MTVDGICSAEFSAVRDILTKSIDAGTDLGAGVSVFVNGKPVVDLRGGFRDRQKTTPFGNTLVCVYSAGKAITAALVMAAISRGQLSYDKKIADIWPEFGTHGKDKITLAHALSHQSGLSAFLEPIDPALWLDWDGLCAHIASLPPLWPLGEGSGYHPQTYGYIIGEVLRRTTGQSVGEQLKNLNLDVHCGIRGDVTHRIGAMVKPPAAPELGVLTPIKKAAFLQKWSSASAPREIWVASESPASNMHATSTGLAQMMQAFATGFGWGGADIDSSTRETALAEHVRANDRILPFELSWGAGVMRNVIGDHYGSSKTAVGHYGFGGSCVFADPAHKLSFAYVPNKMSNALVSDPRALALIEAVYAGL